MKRLRRIIFIALTMLSLVLCVGTCVLWVRSYYAWDAVRWHTTSGDRYSYLSFPGAIMLEHQRNELFYPPYDRPPVPGIEVWTRPGKQSFRSLHWSNPDYEWRAFGDGWVVNRGAAAGAGAQSIRPGGWRNLVIILPFWLVMLMAGILPCFFLIARRRARSRMHAGLCPICNYDLRATPDRCPECGAGRRGRK